MIARFIIVLVILSIQGCGWHLRGSIVLPENIESVYIDNRASNRELENDLIDLLQSNSVTLSQSFSNADLVIVLLDFEQNRRVNSLNSNTIVREYELITEAEYEIKNAQGETLLEPNITQLSRIYTYDQNAVVSASAEERIIQRELRLELAQQIIRRLRFLEI